MNKEEALKKINDLISDWDSNKAILNQTDINAIKVIVKELSMLEEEYKILVVTSKQLEDEQAREIYELKRMLNSEEEQNKKNMA